MMIFLFLLLENSKSESDHTPFISFGNPKKHWKINEQSDVDIEELFKMSEVKHPASTILKEDIDRAKENKEKHFWASDKIRRIKDTANRDINKFKKDGSSPTATFEEFFNNEKLDNLVPRTTPASKTFCPNCHKLGKSFHPNGNWYWTDSRSDEIQCNLCKMIFPNAEYPETLKYQSQWDKEQTITFVNNGPITCMKYKICRSSVNGIIRQQKINYMIKLLPNAGLSYALTDDVIYAKFVKKILLKFSERIPKYLVYCGYSYNEYADCDPHVAVKNLPLLPNEKIAVEPNERTNEFFSGYWSTSRLGTSGQDGELVTMLAEAYDLTCEAIDPVSKKPVYSKEEKDTICRNVLIESALLCFYDPEINNKAVMNRKGAMIVGLVVGNAKLARFGLDGFFRSIDEFYNKDGTTSQSLMYGFKTLRGLDGFGTAFRNYTDPDYFVPGVGDKLYKNLDINHDTNYDLVWQSFMWSTLGNFNYPSIGDNDVNANFDKNVIEYLGLVYKHEEFQSFVNNIQNLQPLPNNDAVFFRDPSYQVTDKKYKMHDIVFPYLMYGYIRTGIDNQDSAIVLDASEGGGHRHLDSLNIVYYKDNKELLNDLGYLLDHPNSSMTQRTSAHNTVLIDGDNQIKEGRKGTFHLFDVSSDLIKVMQASSQAYDDSKRNCDIYNRTIIQIQHNVSKKDYIVDIFRVRGGKKRIENVFHGVNQNYVLSKNLDFRENYEVVKMNGYFELMFWKSGTLSISEISIVEVFPDGKKGSNLVKSIPDKVDPNKCIKGDNYCVKSYKGKIVWEVIEGSKKGTKGFKVTTSDPAGSGINVIFHIGSDLDKLDLKWNAKYEVQFMLKGNVTPDRFAMFYTNEDIPITFIRWVQTSYEKIDNEIWRKFTGTVIIGTPGTDPLGATTSDPLTITWNITNDYIFKTFIPARKNQKIFCLNEGWGQRKSDNSDINTTIPYFFLYRNASKNEEIQTFVQVYEGNKIETNIVKSVAVIDGENGNVVIKIDTSEGVDYVASSFNKTKASGFGIDTDARLAVQTIDCTKVFDGKYYNNTVLNIKEKTNEGFSGTLQDFGFNKTHGWYDLLPKDIDIAQVMGNMEQSIFIKDTVNKSEANFERPYPIHHIERRGNFVKIFTRTNSLGFYPQYGNIWRISGVKTIKKVEGNTNDGTTSSIEENSQTKTDNNDTSDKNTVRKKKNLSGGAIAGVIIAVLVVIGATAFGVVFYLFKLRQKNLNESEQEIQNMTQL